MADRSLETEGWFYQKMSRAQAELLLQTRGHDGSFLVRECENPKGVYVMSYRKSGYVFHTKIDMTNKMYSIAGGRQFQGISKLVQFYSGRDGILTTDTGASIKLVYPLYHTDLTQISWFHGAISQDEARSRLTAPDIPEGSFLVRDPGSGSGTLALCVRGKEDITEICINCKETRSYSIDSTSFPTLPELIEDCYKSPPRDEGGGQLKLTQPVVKTRIPTYRRLSHQEQPAAKSTQPPKQNSVSSDNGSSSTSLSTASLLRPGRKSRSGSVCDGSDTSSRAESTRSGSSGSDSLENQPLYQVYHRNVITREIVEQVQMATEEPQQNGDTSESHDVRLMDEAALQRHVSIILRQSKMGMSTVGQAGARQSCLFDVLKYGVGQLNLWRNLPDVQESGVLRSMDAKAKRLQEALYEIITSEASYLKSVQVLIDHFYNSPVFRAEGENAVLNKQNQRFLFSNIKKVAEVSKGFLKELRDLRKKTHVLDPKEMATTIIEYAVKHFEAYVVYAKNQAYQERALSELREMYPEFNQGIIQLERDPNAQGLPFQSFLLLPVQRITRLPLLLDSALSSMDPDQHGYDRLKECFCMLRQTVIRSNEEAKQMADIEQVAKISEMLDFKKAKKVALVSQYRHLVREGAVTNLGPHFFESGVRKPFEVYLFLFNDLLVITKRKGAGSFEVLVNASVMGISVDILNEEDVPKYLPQGVSSGYSDMFLLTINDKNIKCICSCKSMSHQMRWVEALTPPSETAPTIKLFGENDYPQAQAIQPYVAQEPDELSLDESDIVNVTMKLGDGWWQGHRIHDSQKGWFPSSVVVEIQSAHMRERNRRQQYRLMFGYNRLSNEFIC